MKIKKNVFLIVHQRIICFSLNSPYFAYNKILSSYSKTYCIEQFKPINEFQGKKYLTLESNLNYSYFSNYKYKSKMNITFACQDQMFMIKKLKIEHLTRFLFK